MQLVTEIRYFLHKGMPGAGGDEKDGWEAPEVTDSESDPVDLVRRESQYVP